jgi:hypothetical protein
MLQSLPELCSARHSGATDVGITLRVTNVALPYTVQLEAHEGTRWQDGPLGRCGGRLLEVQDTEEAEQGKIRDRSTVNLLVLD